MRRGKNGETWALCTGQCGWGAVILLVTSQRQPRAPKPGPSQSAACGSAKAVRGGQGL